MRRNVMSKLPIRSLIATPLLAIAMLAATSPTRAQDVAQQEDEEDYADIIVTSAVRQGGAQDIKHFRSMAISSQTLPRPESLTLEGLMGEHDLTLPADRQCDQLFCLVAHSMEASLPTRPDDRLFVGLGFASNIDAESWRREPLSIMAIVDRSGSMTGRPIEAVKASLRQMANELGPNDRLGIAIYGTSSLVHLAPTAVAGNREQILRSIDAIAIDGSTNLEAGLKMGYDAAMREASAFKGKTRMMLFTDEQPNTGNTDSGTFMGIANDASRHGIGMTTIGVGVQYDGALATKISSVRGGNVFFVTSSDDGKALFQKEFRNMVSEVAHDVTITMSPRSGYQVTGVFGVPDGLMTEGKDGAVSVTVPTAFLSSSGGGIFASLGKSSDHKQLPVKNVFDGAPLMEIDLSYVAATDGRQGHDRLAVAAPDAKPAQRLALAQQLVDEYLVLNAATTAYHHDGNAKKAFLLLDGLGNRMASSSFADLKGERELVTEMREKAALFAGYGGEVPVAMRPMQALGKWRVLSNTGVKDLSRGDIIELNDDEEFITYFKKPLRGDDEMYQEFQINGRQIYVPSGNLMVDYAVSGNKMYLTTADGFVRIVLQRAGDVEVAS
jgi:Ca-activated chloride channel homolog